MRLRFVSRYFCRSVRVRGRWNTPNSKLACAIFLCCANMKNVVNVVYSACHGTAEMYMRTRTRGFECHGLSSSTAQLPSTPHTIQPFYSQSMLLCHRLFFLLRLERFTTSSTTWLRRWEEGFTRWTASSCGRTTNSSVVSLVQLPFKLWTPPCRKISRWPCLLTYLDTGLQVWGSFIASEVFAFERPSACTWIWCCSCDHDVFLAQTSLPGLRRALSRMDLHANPIEKEAASSSRHRRYEGAEDNNSHGEVLHLAEQPCLANMPVLGLPSSRKPIHAGKHCLGELIWAYITEGAPKKSVWGINLGIGPWPMQNASRINRQILAMYPEEWVCYGNPSENPSKPLQRAGIGVGARRCTFTGRICQRAV